MMKQQYYTEQKHMGGISYSGFPLGSLFPNGAPVWAGNVTASHLTKMDSLLVAWV